MRLFIAECILFIIKSFYSYAHESAIEVAGPDDDTKLRSGRFLVKVCINTYAAYKLEYTNTCCERMHMRSATCASDPHAYDRLQDDKWEKMERIRACTPAMYIHQKPGRIRLASSSERPNSFTKKKSVRLVHAFTCIAGHHRLDAINGTAIVPRHERCMTLKGRSNTENICTTCEMFFRVLQEKTFNVPRLPPRRSFISPSSTTTTTRGE